jgi:Flp pilus assembly protein TadD
MTSRRFERPRRAACSRGALAVGLALLAISLPAASLARPKPQAKDAAEAPPSAAEVLPLVRQALDEKRYVDASTLLDRATIMGLYTPEMATLRGEVLLARGQYDDALTVFQEAVKDPSQNAAAQQGEGIALSMLSRSDAAMATLKSATALDKTLWRAWNALGREYDIRRDWADAEAAYAAALAAPDVHRPVVLNNRGYSFLIQSRPKEAVADFLAALAEDPGLTAARTNLRIALAFEGAYDRASLAGAADDRAAVLNNVGLAAAMRGDYPNAERYLNEAITARGKYYARAAENLQLARALASRKADTETGPDAAVIPAHSPPTPVSPSPPIASHPTAAAADAPH